MSNLGGMAGGIRSILGDPIVLYYPERGSVINIREGTYANPQVLTDGPAAMITRIVKTTAAELQAQTGSATADGVNALSTLEVLSYSPTTMERQNVAIYGGAQSASTVGSPGNDACGIYGVGYHAGTGVGIGAFLIGRRDSSSGRANALEADSANYSGVAGAYNQTGFSNTLSIWINAAGNADSGAGLVLGNPFGFQFSVGIGFNAQVNGGKTGGVKDSSIRDDSTSTTSIDIRGTHTTAISIASAAGAINLGTNNFGINGATPASKQTVSGAKGGNAALASLLTAMVNFGFITDSTGA